MVRLHKTEAIILRKKNLLNKDILITFISEEYGKIVVFAKGIKKITSKRLPHIQTGNLVDIIIHQDNSYSYLQETYLISAFSEIKKNHEKLNAMYLFFFIVDRLLPENQKEIRIYNLIKFFEVEISKSKISIHPIVIIYINKLLKELGYLQNVMTFDELTIVIEDLIHEKIPLFDI